MPTLNSNPKKTRARLSRDEVRALNAIRLARRLSWRDLADAVGVNKTQLHALIEGPALSEASVARVRAFLVAS